MTDKTGWLFIQNISIENFILKMLNYGPPIETSIVGAFTNTGRGSKRDIPLPLHKDGDYSTKYKNKIKYVGLFCLVENLDTRTLILDSNKNLSEIRLKKHQAIIIDNEFCLHGRKGPVGNRLLLRMWV